MNNPTRILLPAVTAGLVFLFTGSAAYLYSTIQPIPEIPDAFLQSYEAEQAAAKPVLQNEIDADTEVSLPDHLPESGYLIKLKEDTLYVFAEGEREPEAVYELPAEWLPDYDRTLLEFGFRVSNKDELRELIEDYLS